MDYSILVIGLIVIAGIGGFVALAETLLSNWRSQSRGHEEYDAFQSKRTRDFESCYNSCMKSARWEPDEEEGCTSLCQAHIVSSS